MPKIKERILKKGEIIPLTFDPMFTEVFNNEDNICILEDFISYYMNIDIEEVRGNLKLLSRNLKKKNLKSSRKEVDLLLNLKGKKYNIEMSNKWSDEIKDRNVVFLSNIHGEQLKRGFKYYRQIDETIQINLNNFNCQKELKTTYYLRNENGEKFTEKYRIDVINLEKGSKLSYTNDERTNMLIDWCKVFTSQTEKELKNAVKNIMSKQSRNKLIKDINRLSGDDEMIDVYGYRNKWELELESIHRLKYEKSGMEKGMEKGIKKGSQQEKISIAKNLLNLNISIDDISKATGLTKEEIDKLNNLL